MSSAVGSIRLLARKAMRRRRWRATAISLAVVIALFAAATARLFVWPSTGMPYRTDAIVLPAADYAPVGTALSLARAHRASFLVVSLGYKGYGGVCPAPISGIRIICFNPDPATTRGEAEYVGRLARHYGWHSIVVVTITPQAWRAKERVRSCFSGEVFSVAAGMPWKPLLLHVAYEWAASVKMLVFQRSC